MKQSRLPQLPQKDWIGPSGKNPQHLLYAILQFQLRGFYNQFCRIRCFIRGGNSRKLSNFPPARLLIQSFYIALFAYLNWTLAINFNKLPRSNHRPNLISIFPERRNKCGQNDHTSLHEQLGDLPDSPDILHPISC